MMNNARAIGVVLLLLIALLGACSGKDASSSVPPTSGQMADKLVQQMQQTKFASLDAEMMKQMYHLDPAVLEDYAVRTPLLNVRTDEIAILKVKDAADLNAVEAAVRERAADVQRQYESYEKAQYEKAVRYKIVTRGRYVLFVISDRADQLLQTYDSFFASK